MIEFLVSAPDTRKSRAAHRVAAVVMAWFLLEGVVRAETPKPKGSPSNYTQEIDRARADADAGTIAEAKRRLDATQETDRSFEFDYLLTRVKEAPADGGPAPSLLRKIARPKVESRFGVLNGTNREVVFICRDGGLRIHDLRSPETPEKTVAHPGAAPTWTGSFSQDGKRFFSGHQNGEVLVWDVATWEIRQTISLGADWPVRELAVAPDGSAFVAESKSALELWSLSGDEPKKVNRVGDRLNFGEGVAYSPQGDLLATGGMFDIQILDAKTGCSVRSMRHASYTMGLEFSPDGKRIASAPRGNVNKFLAVFDVTGENPLFNVGPFGNYIAGMAFTPDGKRIAATGCEKMLRLFHAETGEVVLTFQRPECGAKPAFTHDGRLLGWSEPDGYWYIDLGKLPE